MKYQTRGGGTKPAPQIPIVDGLFTWPADEPQLIGGKCNNCGLVMFPKARFCARCNSEKMEEILLERRGTLWTWTTQGFPPKSPPYSGTEIGENFRPYAVGYVELPGQLRVEARLTESDPAKLRIDMVMELVIIPFKIDGDGNEIMVFAFRPITQEDHT